MAPLTTHGSKTNDVVFTPDALALDVVRHYLPQISGKILEPSAGGGAFLRAFAECGLTNVDSCEIEQGKDFFDFNARVDWIITNPPWSKARKFLQHAYEIADNVVFLITLNHVLGLSARLRDMEKAGFGIKEVLLYDTPPTWPSSGFQVGVVHLQRGADSLFKRKSSTVCTGRGCGLTKTPCSGFSAVLLTEPGRRET